MEGREKKRMTPPFPLRKGVLFFDEKNWKFEFDEWNKKNDNALEEWLSTGEIVKVYDWEYIKKDRLLQMEDVVKQFFRIVDKRNLSKVYEMKDKITSLCDKRISQVQNKLSNYFSQYENGQEWKESLYNCTTRILEQPQKIIEIIEHTPNNLTKYQKISYQYYSIKSELPVYDFALPFQLGCSSLRKLSDAHLATNESKRPLLNVFLFLDQFIAVLRDFNRYKIDLMKSKFVISYLSLMDVIMSRYRMIYGDFSSSNIDRTINEILPTSIEKFKSSEEINQNDKEYLKTITEILREMFPNALEVQLSQFQEALLGQKKPGFVEVKYVGTKESLYKYLGKLRKAGLNRRRIATVFSEKCKWKRYSSSQEESISSNVLYRKML